MVIPTVSGGFITPLSISPSYLFLRCWQVAMGAGCWSRKWPSHAPACYLGCTDSASLPLACALSLPVPRCSLRFLTVSPSVQVCATRVPAQRCCVRCRRRSSKEDGRGGASAGRRGRREPGVAATHPSHRLPVPERRPGAAPAPLSRRQEALRRRGDLAGRGRRCVARSGRPRRRRQ